MSKDYQQITSDVNQMLGKINKENPDVMKSFMQLSQAASKDGALSAKTKELMALSIGIAQHCDACIGFHTQKLIKLGVSREEFVEMLGVATYMGGGPSLMYAADALSAFEQFSQ